MESEEELVSRLRVAMADQPSEPVDQLSEPMESHINEDVMDGLQEAIRNLGTQVTTLSSVCLGLVETENKRQIEMKQSLRSRGMRETRAILWGKPIYIGPLVLVWDGKRRSFTRTGAWKFWKK